MDISLQPSYTADMSVKDSLAIINQVTPQTANKFYAVDTEDKILPCTVKWKINLATVARTDPESTKTGEDAIT
ncbi:hypothetical protein BT69DRAFT_1344979 [Atractiella rhizophila]|nr:hypothetical protein BT69DRAFT_1344979 [Atractiella rhizophila]